MNAAGLRSVGVGLVSLALGAGALLASGCRSQTAAVETTAGGDRPTDDASTGSASNTSIEPWASRAFVESVTIDGGDAGGPNCAAAGDPTVGLDGGVSCTGALAQTTFTFGLCSCTGLQSSNHLTTDGFDSTKGAPDGGVGGSVGVNGDVTWSGATNVGGSLKTRGNIASSQTAVVRQDLQLGGTLSSSATFTVDGNAQVVKTLPASAKVLGTVSKVASVAAPCNCTNPVPTASIVAAHRGTNNDDALIGLSPNGLQGNNPSRVDLPCGNYYVSQINSAQALTIAVHGHTALYVDGSVTVSGALAFQIDPTATLDLFVAGTFTASNTLTLGSQANPAHCRMYLAGTSIALSGSATLGCNIYAPSALFTLSNNVVAYGSVFANNIQASGNATVHYDTAILNAGSECCTASSCDDGNPCTVDSCNGDGTCNHAPATNGTACAGTNKCEQTYTCQAGACTGSNPVTCTAADQCHTAGTCNPATGTCSNPVAANGTSCSDGNACTQTDACQSGVCTGSNPVTCTAADQCHTAGMCNPGTGACSNPVAANGTSCSDGNACTQTDACQSGVCTGSNPVACAAADQCHLAGTCNPGTGTCSNPVAANGTSCSDGNACTQTDACQSGVCTGSNPVTCAAADQCHLAGTCNPSTGACSNPVAANGTSCSDGNACTQNDSCQTGACSSGASVTCTASDQCHAAGTCNPTTGACSNPVAANGTSCSDGNACTQNDSCQNGACSSGAAVTCTASDQCHAAGTCNPSTGTCSNPVAANGTSCSDGNACTQNDSCQNGACSSGAAVTCTASDQCHAAGTCNPSTGTCSNPVAANGTSCSDGNACTQGDSCQSGTCVGASPVTCAPPGACQAAATCNPQTGCSYPAIADGTPCSGTDRCNQVYACAAGTCTGSNPVTCTASDACHAAGTCDPTSGACSNPAAADGTSCNDGNACTLGDACHGGTCTGGAPVGCAAKDGCHVAGVCNPASGMCSNPAATDGTPCGSAGASPGQVCTAGACGAPAICTTSQTLCNGVCASTQSDASHCGSCGNACAAGSSCVAGTCVAQAVMAACGLPTGSMSVLVSGEGVTAYVPNGSWSSVLTGVQRIVLEGGTAFAETIPTPNAVNSCASNWVTGETVCTSNGTDVYLIRGNAITATLTSGATGTTSFSGGRCQNCGVAIDAVTNKAVLEIGVNLGPGLQDPGAFQFLDLSTHVFDPPIATAINPLQGGGFEHRTSENVAIDSIRHLLLSPNEFSDYELVQYGTTPAAFSNIQFPKLTPNSGNLQSFDSAAEDCTTGIALTTDESASSSFTASGAITLVDLTQAAFTPGLPSGTWTAPSSTQVLKGMPRADGFRDLEMTGIAVAPGSHLALVANEGGGGTFAALKLPSSSGTGTPALVDWAATLILSDPNGGGWSSGFDPHILTAYTSPRTGRAMALAANSTGSGLGAPSFVALFDLQGLLDAPRLSGTHNVDPTYDLAAHGVVTFIPLPCSQAATNTDPTNCGRCGNVCPGAPHAQPACSLGGCTFACDAGRDDCNGLPADGCEAILSTDPSNCGRCGKSCGAPNAVGVCGGGQCAFQCNQGFSDCDGNASNGCETAGVCAAPTVSVSGPTSVAVGERPTYVATATEPVPGRTLALAWTALSGPGTVTFSAPSALTTTAQFSLPGTYVLQFEASDGFTTTAASLTVAAAYVNLPPVVSVGPAQTLAAPAMATTLTGSATDDGLPLGSTLSATWSLVSGPVAVAMSPTTATTVAEPGPLTASTNVTFSYPGTYVFQLAVSDGQLVGAATQTVTVTAPAASAPPGTTPVPPTMAIGGLSDDQVVTKPTPILLTVSDGSWVVERRLGGRDDVDTPWTVMASGTGAASGATVATFDPTLLLNGIYTVRVSATNSAGSASTSVSLSVDGRMKVGNFTLAFTDLDVAVAGVPFAITRQYDSRDKTVGDFGVGWKLGISDVRVEKSGKIGAYWKQQFIDAVVFTQFCLRPTQAASVTITFPGGRQYRFQAKSSPECRFIEPLTAPDIVWESTSDPGSPTVKLRAAGDTSEVARDIGNGVVQLQDANFTIWDPRQFTLTVEDGSVYEIDQDKGVTQVTDGRGNRLTVTRDGILHSSGAQVSFVRDEAGRIKSITDPSGKSMTYAYDGHGDLASHTDRVSNTTQFSYVSNHYLDQIQDPLGRLPIRNEYDADGRLLSATDATGHKVQYTHNLASNEEQVVDRLGHVTLYTYNDRGDVTQKTDATGAVWKYSFDIRGNKLSETDPLGRTKTTSYDAANNPLTETDALGNVTTHTYDGFSLVVTTTDPLGHVTANGPGGYNRQSTSDALGNATLYTYDTSLRWVGLPLTETDAAGGVTRNAYDDAGRVVERTNAVGVTTMTAYDANGRKVSEVTPRTNFDRSGQTVLTTYKYDAEGRLLQTQKGTFNALIDSTTYTATGKRASTTDRDGRVTSYGYDALDRLVTTTRPDGTTVTQTYDAENRMTSSTDASGNTTSYTYDAVGRRIRTTYADGASSATAYDSAGQAIEAVDARGHVQWTTYDAAGRRTSTTDAVGGVTRYAYDAAGNQLSVTDALGRRTEYAYDAANRLVATTYADGSAESTRYDRVGRVLEKTDALGRATAYAYDGIGELVMVTDALGQVTTYTYDEAGARTSQRDAGRRRTIFRYDLLTGVETARGLPDGVSVERWEDDAAGQVLKRTDFAGQTTLYTYDAMGHVLTRAYPDASVVSLTYTPTGQRATETDTRGTTSYGYDSRNRLVKLTYPDGRVLGYGYDAQGNRTSVTAKIGTQTLTTTTAYDAANRPTQVTDPLGRAFALAYDVDGNRTELDAPNTTSTTYAYDALNRLTNLTTVQKPAGSVPTTTQSYAYTLDLAGKRTQVSEADGTVRAYTYDSIDRLTGETVTGSLSYAKAFDYDPVGNRLTQTTTGAGAGAVTYRYDVRDQLTTENGTAYGYDPNGNVTSKAGEATYAWDFENRLSSATMSDGTVVAHAYDPDGNRVKTTVTPAGGGTPVATSFLVDTSGGLSQVMADTDGSGNVAALYVRNRDELLEVMRPAARGTWTTRYIHSDGLGSVRLLTDETGTTVDTRGYEAFGTKNTEAGTDALRYGFAGEAFEGTSRLAYHRARWMDARVGRFEGVDPVDAIPGRTLGLNRYIYAGDSPAVYVDPSGREYDMASVSVAIAIVSVLALSADTSIRGFLPDRSSPYFIDVRASRLIVWDHLFLIVGHPEDQQIYRAGPSSGIAENISSPYGDNPPPANHSGYGVIDPVSFLYTEQQNVDWDPNAPRVRVASGSDVPRIEQCFDEETNRIREANIAYLPWGPNSNSYVSTLLSKCGLPLERPEGVAPGFGDSL